MTFESFAQWGDLLDYAREYRPLYYQAPLDVRPVRVDVRVNRNLTIRVFNVIAYRPREADPFTADRAHLDRFRRPTMEQG